MTKWQAKSGRRVVSGKSKVIASINGGKIKNAAPVIAEAKQTLAKGGAKPGEKFRLSLVQEDDKKIGAWSVTPVGKKAPSKKKKPVKAKKAKKAKKKATAKAKTKTKKKATAKVRKKAIRRKARKTTTKRAAA